MAVERVSKSKDKSRRKLIIAFGWNYAANIVYNFIFGNNIFNSWI